MDETLYHPVAVVLVNKELEIMWTDATLSLWGIGLKALRQTTKIRSNANWPPRRVCTVLCSSSATRFRNVPYFALATFH